MKFLIGSPGCSQLATYFRLTINGHKKVLGHVTLAQPSMKPYVIANCYNPVIKIL
jgi:hypothetical protein